MSIASRMRALRDEMVAWRRDIHAHPETAYEEHRTAGLVAGLLRDWGIDVHTGVGGTGVVGTLRTGGSERSIALRAELDALPIEEANEVPYASRVAGKMHACGHDGHAAMLLGAARSLAETRRFDGAVHFIFQPAEENEAGGKAMIDDGLFDLIDVDDVYGMHNWPGMPVGEFAARPGPVTAALDLFEIRVEGKGCHAAMPHAGSDTIACAAALITALQAIPARDIDPLQTAVISVTQVRAGNTWNVIPEVATLRGTARAFSPRVQDVIERRAGQLVKALCSAHECVGALEYRRHYPAAVNSERETRIAAAAAASVARDGRVDRQLAPTTGAEDFAFMLLRKPGCYLFIGNGEDSAPLHSPAYDFNDAALEFGAGYWVSLVERELPVS